MEPRRQKPEREYAYAQELPTRDKFVLVAMADMAKDRHVFASRKKLKQMTTISERRITDIIKRLIEGGHIARIQAPRIEDGVRMAADYYFVGMGDAASPVTQRHGCHSVTPRGDTASSVQVTQRHPNYKTTVRKNKDGSDADASKPVRSPKPKFDPAAISLPHGNALSSAWAEFAQHRREIRAPLTPTAAKRIIDDLASVNERDAVEALRKSVKHGWRGVFVDKPADEPKVVPIRTGPIQPSEAERRMLELEARMKGAA